MTSLPEHLVTWLAVLLLVAVALADPLPDDRRISLELENAPLDQVLTLIARQNGLNIVMSTDVEGDVSVRLENVGIRTALDAVLSSNGYNYFLKGDVIVVKPIDRFAIGELRSEVITLRYLNPETARKALEAQRTERGHIVILDRGEQSGGNDPFAPNRLLITDYPDVVDGMLALIESMDVAEHLILIEARIIETKVDAASKLGFLWPTSVGTRLSGAESDLTTDGEEVTSSDVRRSAAGYDLESGDWTWGTLSIEELNIVLDALEQDGNSKLISDPRVTTLENHEAEISIVTIIPIQTINRFTEGASTSDIVTFQDEEVGISLRVTPRLNGNGRITLDVFPKVEDIIGYVGTSDNRKPITSSRSVRTRISVDDGETLVLGGLLKEDEIENQTRVPLLGHIPLLGKLLFTNTSIDKSTSDLIIMITPHILK